MSDIKISWDPSTDANIASYEIDRADTLTNPVWAVLATIPHNITGPNYDATTQTFFYVDTTGDNTKYYTITAIDTLGQRSAPSTPFQASVAAAPTNTVKVDHNYPTPGNLLYQASNGTPIEGATIRVYKKSDYDLGNTTTPLAVTVTNAQGGWVDPIYLTTGFTYTVQFAKEGLYGPDTMEITV